MDKQKWEYCLLGYLGAGIFLYGSDGEITEFDKKEYTLASALSLLGNNGWEAVTHQSALGSVTGGIPHKSLMSGKLKEWPTTFEILFKRPKE